MDSKMEPMKLVFTSYRDSIGMEGIKVSLDRRAPKLCSYPALNYLIMPAARHMAMPNLERICNAVLDNNWDLVQDFITEIYNLGIQQIAFCCWCTKEQIAAGKFCTAGIIGKYIETKADEERAFKFPIEIEYGDGREGL